jgi:hypothetical protein
VVQEAWCAQYGEVVGADELTEKNEGDLFCKATVGLLNLGAVFTVGKGRAC